MYSSVITGSDHFCSFHTRKMFGIPLAKLRKRVTGKQGILMFHFMLLQCLKNIFKVRYIVFKRVKHNLQINIAVVMNDSVAQAGYVAPGHR